MANKEAEKRLEKVFNCKIIYRQKIHNKRIKVNSKFNSGMSYLVYTNKKQVFEILPKREFLNRYVKTVNYFPHVLNKYKNVKKEVSDFILEAIKYLNRKNKNEK